MMHPPGNGGPPSAAFVALTFAALLLTAGCRSAAPPSEKGAGEPPRAETPGPGVVAVINGEAITEGEYAGELAAAAFLAKQASLEGRMEVLNSMIDTRLLLQDAGERGVADRPVVKRMIARKRRRAVMAAVRRKIYTEVPVPTEEEVEEVIVLPGPALDFTVLVVWTEEEAEKAIDRIEAGEEMEKVAREVSTSPGARLAGTVTMSLKRGSDMYAPETEEALFSLEEGETSPPLSTPVGFLVARLDGRRLPSEEDLEKLRSDVSQGMHRRRLVEALESLTKRRREMAEIRILRDRFEGADLPVPGEDNALLWKALEEVRAAEVDGVLLTLGDIFRNGADYRNSLSQRIEAQEKVYRTNLERNIDQVALLGHAREEGLHEDPSIDRQIDSYTSSLLLAREVDDLVGRFDPDSVDETRCRQFYEEREGRFPVPPLLTLSRILVRRRKELDAVVSRYRQGEDFAALAREFSIAESAPAGGDLGQVLADELGHILDEQGTEALLAAARSGAGDIVTIRTQSGFNILLIRDFKDAGEGGYEAIRERVRPVFVEFCRRETVRKEIAALREKAAITIDEEKVASIEPADEAPPGRAPHGAGGAPARSPHGGGGSPHGGGGPPAGSRPPGHP